MATKTTTVDQATRDAIHRALPGPNGDQWTTAKAVAEVVGKGYSTVTEHLRAMVDAGAVGMDRQGRSNVFRKTAASPMLAANDVPTPRAEPVAPAGDGRTAAQAARAKRNRAKAMREGYGVDPVADGHQAARDVVDAMADDAGEQVWMATKRKGLNYHRIAEGLNDSTVCGRSMRTGVTMPRAEVAETSTICRECGAAELARVDAETPTAETATDAPEPVAVPQPPPAANTPAGGDMGAVVGFMESVRPVSAPPVEPVKARRTTPRDPDAPRTEWAVWKPGELQAAIVAHAQKLPAGESIGPGAMARALNSQPGSVAFAINRLVVLGNLVKTSENPPRFAAV